MIPSLPADFFARMNGFLQPYMADSDEREAWLTQAFYLREPRLFHQIDRAGSAMVFTTKCIQKLLTFECLANPTEHALATLLKTLRYGVGTKQQLDIDAFVSQLDELCIGERPAPKIVEQPSTPNNPAQSMDTPNTERTPTVFVSYSHDDKAFAERLIADLQAGGHAVWIDVSRLKGGDLWIRAISEGIINSYAFIVLATRQALSSAWVQDEITWAKQRGKPIIPLLLEDVVDDTDFFPLARYQGIRFHNASYSDALTQLLAALPTSPANDIEQPVEPAKLTRRALELQYMDRLRFEILLNMDRYTALSGTSHQHSEQSGSVPFVLMRPEYTLLTHNNEQLTKPRRFDNAVEELLALRRAVVLGEPGAGKTTTLWKLAHKLAHSAIVNEQQPIPLVIRLGKWVDEHQPLEDFIRGELGALGPHLENLLRDERAALLLDGLNEIPAAQRSTGPGTSDKTLQVERFVHRHFSLLAIVSCRAQDYTTDLGLSRVEIAPLDPIRIREFCTRYLETEKGIGLFERLIGRKASEFEREFRTWAVQQPLEDPQQVFWLHSSLPLDLHWGYANWSWQEWLKHREQPNSLLALARNPYLLSMLTQVYVANQSHLPENRGELFHYFVLTLLLRERIIELDKQDKPIINIEATQLLDALANFAYAMQIERSASNSGNALTSVPLRRVQQYISETQLYRAGSASLIVVGESVRFSHQLLQEYFAARYMDGELKAGRLKASNIWPPHEWWKRTNWEEAAIMLAGFYPADCTHIIEWMAGANPEVTAQCIIRSGSVTPDSTRARLRDLWLSMLRRMSWREREPLARAAIGRALGLVTVHDQPADNRKGVSVLIRGNIRLPEIDWVEIPAGRFQTISKTGDIKRTAIFRRFQNDAIRELILPTFSMSRYLVTYIQFQVFVEDKEGFFDQRWWEGLTTSGSHPQRQIVSDEQAFKYWNHPRDYVSWLDATAYCRWLSWRLGYGYELDDIGAWAARLPTEFEWEKAARGKDGLLYPYGNEFDSAKCNSRESGIDQTSAVGIFAEGESPYGLLDLSGNVWEWCLNNYKEPMPSAHLDNLSSGAVRTLCGGAWNEPSLRVSTESRYRLRPNIRQNNVGFRLCRGELKVPT